MRQLPEFLRQSHLDSWDAEGVYYLERGDALAAEMAAQRGRPSVPEARVRARIAELFAQQPALRAVNEALAAANVAEVREPMFAEFLKERAKEKERETQAKVQQVRTRRHGHCAYA